MPDFAPEHRPPAQSEIKNATDTTDTEPSTPLVARFSSGKVVATPGALEALQKADVSLELFLARHLHGDWGEMDATDKTANDLALQNGSRLLSAYDLPRTGARLWIITEADRSVTTLLLPEEY